MLGLGLGSRLSGHAKPPPFCFVCWLAVLVVKRTRRSINPDIHATFLDVLGVSIVTLKTHCFDYLTSQTKQCVRTFTILAIHHRRCSMIKIAQPWVFFNTRPIILLKIFRRFVIRGAKDFLVLGATKFSINDVSLHNHPGPQ